MIDLKAAFITLICVVIAVVIYATGRRLGFFPTDD